MGRKRTHALVDTASHSAWQGGEAPPGHPAEVDGMGLGFPADLGVKGPGSVLLRLLFQA